MQPPHGSIVALSSASATIFSIGMLFLGYWGFMEPPPWTIGDFCVVVPALMGFASLGLVPWIATTPVAAECDEKVPLARHAFLLGVASIMAAILIALYTNTLPRPGSVPSAPAAARAPR